MTDGAMTERLTLIADANTLEALGITVQQLADPDTRAVAIRRDHPDLDRALRSGGDVIEVAGEPMNIRLHLAMHQAVAAQLADNDPPEVYLTARRLLDSGYECHEVLHMLAGAIADQIHAALTGAGGYDRDRHLAALNALPESWERQQRQSLPPPRPRNRAERRARTKRRRR